MSAAAALQDLLERSGMSKKELCEAAGISRSSLDEYLKGKRQPSVAQVERLGEAANLRLDLAWAHIEHVETRRDPSWLIPDNPAMKAPPLAIEERARVLERVVAVAMAQRRRPRGPLAFPPFKSLGKKR